MSVLGPVLPCRFGRYTLVERVGAGGMATVYRALLGGEGGFEKEVAVKVVREELASDPQFRTLFLDEARLSALLAHANLVQTFDFGQVDGTWFMAMEYVRGRTLANLLRALRARNLSPGPVRSLHLAAEVAKGLGLAHRLAAPDGTPLGLVHRDVSPQNVLVSTEGEVKLGDFGIAKAALRSQVTAPGRVRGKCAYMAPEQARGRPVDARADVFALGVVLWECLTGTALFEGGSDAEILLQVLQKGVVPPSRLRAEVPAEVDALVLRMLAREPSLRPANGDEAARELAALRLRLARSPADLDLAELERALRSGTAVQLPVVQSVQSVQSGELPISNAAGEGTVLLPPRPPEPPLPDEGVAGPADPAPAAHSSAAAETVPIAPPSTGGSATVPGVSAASGTATQPSGGTIAPGASAIHAAATARPKHRWRSLGLVLLSAGLGVALGVGALALVREVPEAVKPVATVAGGAHPEPVQYPGAPRDPAPRMEMALEAVPPEILLLPGAANGPAPSQAIEARSADTVIDEAPPPVLPSDAAIVEASPVPTEAVARVAAVEPAPGQSASVARPSEHVVAQPEAPGKSARTARPSRRPAPIGRSVAAPASVVEASRTPSNGSAVETAPGSVSTMAELVVSARLDEPDAVVHVRVEGGTAQQLGWSPLLLAVSEGQRRVTFVSASRTCEVTVRAIAGGRVTLNLGPDGSVRLIDGMRTKLLPCE